MFFPNLIDMKFKLYSPHGWENHDLWDDNIDVYIITENGNIYFVVFCTLLNVLSLMMKDEFQSAFWIVDAVYVRALDQKSLVAATVEILLTPEKFQALEKIGTEQGGVGGYPWDPSIEYVQEFEIPGKP